jgi:L-malate glycosyltransferase
MRIKVLHLIKSLGRGGAEMLLPETLKLHNLNEFEFEYAYFLPWKNQVAKDLADLDVKVTCFSARNNIGLMMNIPGIIKYIRENNIQIVHAHLPWAGIVARIIGVLTKVKIVYTEHNKQERYHFLTRFVNLLTMNWQSQVIGVSEDVAVSIRKWKPQLKVGLKVVLNGVNQNRFKPGVFLRSDVRNELGILDSDFVILTIAVFRFQKRLDVWLENAHRILGKVDGAHFIIVGQGPLEKSLRDKVKLLGIEAKVHFVGQQKEVRPYLATCDIYMMSSIFEGLPIALLEAMASSCAVVSTDAGGIKEVINDGVNGYLCPVDKPEMLSDLALALMFDPKKRGEFGLRARERILEKFSMKSMVLQLEETYRELAE